MKYLIFICAAALAVSGCEAPNDTAAKPAEAASPPVTITAAEISKAFQENEVKAKLAYEGKSLQVTGLVKDVTLDFMDKPVISLKGAGEQYGAGISAEGKMTDVSIGGLPNEAAADIKKGTEMTFICTEIGEVLGGVQLNSCKIAS